jgi:TolA-binding protein
LEINANIRSANGCSSENSKTTGQAEPSNVIAPSVRGEQSRSTNKHTADQHQPALGPLAGHINRMTHRLSQQQMLDLQKQHNSIFKRSGET